MTTMKAVRIHEYGGADVMRVEEVERPTPGTGDLLVRVVAAGVNPVDWKTRAGYLQAMVPLRFPWTPGGDFSGVVEGVGASVTGLKEGDAVFGKVDLPSDGSYAEYVVVPRAHAAAKPSSLDHVKAAAVPLAAMTAWQGLFGGVGEPSLELTPGQTVLILGASGGVGSFAVQLAVARGATVIAVVRGRRGEEELVRGLGASEVVTSDRMDAVGPADAVLDLVGGDVQARAWTRVREGGASASTMGPPDAREAQGRRVRAAALFTQTSGSQLDEIRGLIDAGKVRVPLHEVLPLVQVRQAHMMLEGGGVRGKVVLAVGDRRGS